MKKRFIVCVEVSTNEQSQLFLDYIIKNNLGWWHWMSNFWLLNNSSGNLNSENIRDELLKIYPEINNIVIEITNNGDTWSAYGPRDESKNYFKWLHDNWKKF
ncbi:MAG: hypothetical protein NTW49_02795 [Bacteroidia bacterium]|nr:hypothetical protein [Bacteroidia bacterium]